MKKENADAPKSVVSTLFFYIQSSKLHILKPPSLTIEITAMKKSLLSFISLVVFSFSISAQSLLNPDCNTISLSVNETFDTTVANRVAFMMISDSAVLDQFWNISKSTYQPWAYATLHKKNPAYDFADSGYYKVCVNALFANGCRKEFCKFISINNPIPEVNPCNMQVTQNASLSTVDISVNPGSAVQLHAKLYNYLNMLVLSKEQQGITGTNVISFNISNFVAGNYFIRLEYDSNVCIKSFTKN